MNDFFVEKEEKTGNNVRPKRVSIPPEYLEVALSSLGKLGMPSIIHVRDYTGGDTFKLSLSSDEKLLETLVGVLDDMIFEDIDINTMHEEDIIEILMNVHINFWSSTIADYPYPITDEEWENLPEKKKDLMITNNDYFKVDLDLTNIKTEVIADEFQEPINITIKEETVGFTLPKIGYIFEAQDYVEKKYVKENQQFQGIKNKLEFNETQIEIDDRVEINEVELAEYKKFVNERLEDYVKINRSLSIVSINGKKLETIEEKIEVYDKISGKFWGKLNKIKEKYSNFGVQSDIKMISPIDNKPVIRRCQFRLMELIPQDGLQEYEEATVLFGDK